MKNVLVFTLILILLLFPKINYADSPITSTPFADVYCDEYKIVQKASISGVMTLEIATYLSNPDEPIDVKAAVINALSWKFEGKNNAELYTWYLAITYKKELDELYLEDLHPDEVFCLGYLTIMDDYFNPEPAISILEEAKEMNEMSFTVAIILTLTKAQKAMDSDWCTVWKLTEAVLEDDKLERDLDKRAIDIIVDYMSLYKDDCK